MTNRPAITHTPKTATAPPEDLRALLAGAGLRITRPRLALANLLFCRPHCHFTAEMLHRDVMTAGEHLSLATIYNTLHHFTEAGLLRLVSVEGRSSWFDTNITDHHHFYFEESGRLEDCPREAVDFSRLPDLPSETELAGVDVVIRVRNSQHGKTHR